MPSEIFPLAGAGPREMEFARAVAAAGSHLSWEDPVNSLQRAQDSLVRSMIGPVCGGLEKN